MELPLLHRGEGNYKKLQPGIHLPSWLIDGCREIDSHLQFVWHPFEVLWDDIINQYPGSAEDPRFTIGRQDQYGDELLFGWVLTDGKGRPKQDNHWHLWRLCPDAGWAHIIKFQDNTEEYLRIFLDRFHLQAQIQEKYGNHGWNKFLRAEDATIQAQKETQAVNLFKDRSDENRSLMRKAYENFLNGKISATHPTKDVISSYAGQKNRSRIIRPLTDKEGGLV